MKEETIRAGDTVQVVRGPECCSQEVNLGMTTTVTHVDFVPVKARCNHCGHVVTSIFATTEDSENQDDVFAITQLKKIHPPEAGEQETNPASLTLETV